MTDFRHATRALTRIPGFTSVCTLTLALSLGAATAVFTVLDGVLLQPLSYPQSDSLVSLWNAPQRAEGTVPFSATQFFTYRDESRVFAAFGMWSTGTATVTAAAQPEEVRTLRVTHGVLDALAVPPSARPLVLAWGRFAERA